jgi:hypothetical protein
MNIPIGELLVRDRVVTAAQLSKALEQQRVTGQRLGDTLVGLGFMKAADLDTFFQSVPPVPRSAADTGLPMTFLTDLMLKIAFFRGQAFNLPEMSRQMCLPVGVVDELAEAAKGERLVAVRTGGGFSRMSYIFGLTDLGIERTENALRLSQYAGPAPVPLQAYRIMTAHQTVRQIDVDAAWIEHALEQLVIGNRVLQQLGPAFNSGRSIFLYGPAGTGKSSIAEALGRGLEGSVYIPHAIQADNQVIRLYDPSIHLSTDGEAPPGGNLDLEHTFKHDPRWVLCHRPVVLVGGELGLEELDLEYDPISKFYEAPAHMKAANGLFILDDFGRQRVPPRQLLNRWIVPLERGTDFLELHTGKKLEIPFDQITVFCTNLKPGELVDEAFLRRIRHKIQIPNQTEEEFIEILQRVCRVNGIAYKADAVAYLVDTYYRKANRAFVGSHPRDLVDQITDRARFRKQVPELSVESIDAAAANYFVSMS